MDVANGHLEKIVSMAQSNSCKVQWHHLVMEGLVGQQCWCQSWLRCQVLQGEGPEDELGNELEDGAGVEVGAKEDGQQSKAKDKGKERAL
ncbi:hypothetical protein ID866_10511 [Astraeus odoratus]|nr:hypothetical protein ID866_10511 [Astraeus odoratus]